MGRPLKKTAKRKFSRNMLAGRIRALRNQRGLSLADLAARCGVLGWAVSRETLGKIEAGYRSIYEIETWVLANALRLKMEDLFPPRLNAEAVAVFSKRPDRAAKSRKRDASGD